MEAGERIAELKVACGSVVTNPAMPVVMGCGETREPEGRVHDDVECNALVLRSAGDQVVLITLDALYVGPVLRGYIESRFAGVLAAERIFMAASHTHSAPQVDPTKPALGLPDRAHLDLVCELVGDLVARLLAEPGEEVRVEATRYRTDVAVNRRKRRLVSGAERRLVFNEVVMSPNPAATGDQYGHLVAFVGDGGPVAFLWQLPCHPTSCPSGRGISASYPGIGRAALRDAVGRTVPVLFLQGFSGDLRPPAVHRPVDPVGRLRRVVLGLMFSAFTEDEYADWTARVADEISLARLNTREIPATAGERRVRVARDCEPAADYHDGVADGRHMCVHAVQVDGVTVLGVSAEPVSGYTPELIHRSDTLVIPVGCIDDVVGYAPTTRVLAEGGYEGARFARHFSVGPPRKDYEPRLRAQIDRALSTASRSGTQP